MFCTNCGSTITEGAGFCVNCGQAVQTGEDITTATAITTSIPPAPVPEPPVFCTMCGEKLAEGAVFCTQCGWKVGGVVLPRQERPPVHIRQVAARKPSAPKLRKKVLFALAACLVAAVGVGLFTRKPLKEAQFFSVDLNRRVTFGTPVSFSGGGSLADELQWLAVRTACIGVYSYAQTSTPTREDPKDHYQPGDIREFLTGRSGPEIETDVFYGVCFNYAQAAYEDMSRNSDYFQQLGVREWHIATTSDDPNQITLYNIASRSSEADTTMNGVNVKTVSRQNARAHSDTTNHAWLWVYGNDEEIYWIDPTWTDNTGYVVWGVVRNGEEVQLNPLESLNKVAVNPSDDSFAWINQGNANKNRGLYEQAIADYTAALQKDPGNAAVYVSRGIAYHNKGDTDKAIADFNQAIRLDPKHALAYAGRGFMYIDNGDYDRALADLNQTIRLDPNDARYYVLRGGVLSLLLDYDSAIADCTQAIRLDPKYAEAFGLRGLAYTMKGDRDRAIADYTQAITLEPNNAGSYHHRGIAYHGKGDYDRAIADYTQAITLEPNNADTYFRRSGAYLGKYNYDSAIADSTQAITLDPNNAVAYIVRGSAYNVKGYDDRAIADCTQAIRLDPSNADAYEIRGLAYTSKGYYDRAIADFEAALRINPNDAGARESLALARRARGW